MKPNILIINGSFAGGGANQIAYTILHSLKNKFNMFGLVGDQGTGEENVHSYSRHFNRHIERYLNYFGIATGLQYLVAKYILHRDYRDLSWRPEYRQANLIHLHNLHGLFFNLDILPRVAKDKPIVWTLQDEWSFTGHCAKTMGCQKWRLASCENCPFLRRYYPIMLDTSNYFFKRKKNTYSQFKATLVAPSNWMATKIRNSILKDYPIEVIHNGADTNIFKPGSKDKLRSELGLPKDKFIISFIANHGNKNPWKGSFYLQEIISRRVNDKFLFLSVGNPTSQESRDQNYLEIGFVKDRKQLAKYYAASDILIHPSLADTCPLTVFESLACGTPVVAFRTEGIIEMIDHRKDGYLADYENVDDLINGILYFYNHPVIRNRAGRLGRQKVVKHYTLNHMNQKYAKLYKDVLEERMK